MERVVLKKIIGRVKRPLSYAGLVLPLVLGSGDSAMNRSSQPDFDKLPTHQIDLAGDFDYSLVDEVFESSPDPVEVKLRLWQEEFEQIVKPIFLASQHAISSLKTNREIDNLENLQKNYAFYRAAGEKFDIPWHFLVPIHGEESTFSLDKRAFSGKTSQYGAMQRETDFYPETEVAKAAEGLEFLADLEQEHWDDWREIAWAASKLDRDARREQEKHPNKTRYWTLEDAVVAYNDNPEGNGPGVAQRRIINSRILRGIFQQAY